jgi:hypothetical protein
MAMKAMIRASWRKPLLANTWDRTPPLAGDAWAELEEIVAIFK